MNNIEEYKKERLPLIKENAYINGFIKANKLDDSFISEHFNSFNDCLLSLELCKNCPGLDNCKQRKRGEYVGLEYDGLLNNNINYCDLYLMKEKYSEYASKFVYSDIPDSLYELNLNNIPVDDDALKQLFVMSHAILDGTRKKGLYIYGDIGVGKTYMCIALANSLLQKNKKVAFIKTNDFATKMAQIIMEDVQKYERIVNRIKKADYVIFDDIGSEPVSEFVRDRLLFNILDFRMEHKLCTIFTSNLDKKTLYNHYADSKNSIKAQRLIERIDVLSDNYCLKGEDKRRNNND